ncbi:MAG: hypothetical protein OXN96_21785 [Bryobacterales bacterium]|nr:hypothetical protein [Bryobacterales bacterium]
MRTNCGHVAETAESGYSAVEAADVVWGEWRRRQEQATAGGPEHVSAAHAVEASAGLSRKGGFLASFRLVRGAERPASFRKRV